MKTPIFEQTTSALYYSNDQRLHLVTDPGDGIEPIEYALVLIPAKAETVDLSEGIEVFRTHDRVKADAYIAGYDLAGGREENDDAFREGQWHQYNDDSAL